MYCLKVLSNAPPLRATLERTKEKDTSGRSLEVSEVKVRRHDGARSAVVLCYRSIVEHLCQIDFH
jgi:hypothetical protein